MYSDVYDMLVRQKKKFGGTISWRLKAHAKVIQKHLNEDEEVLYAFSGQKNFSSLNIFNTYAVVLTNKRIMIAQKRLIFGYFFLSITPEMFNDITIKCGLFWAKVNIDTIKEEVTLSNISKGAVTEIETTITDYMMNEKRKFGLVGNKEQA